MRSASSYREALKELRSAFKEPRDAANPEEGGRGKGGKGNKGDEEGNG